MNIRLTKRLYNENEAAEYLNRSIDAMKKLRYRGLLKFVQIGRRIQYDINDLNSFIEANKKHIDY